MALIKAWGQPKIGVSYLKAYHRIAGIMIDPINKKVQVTVAIYISKKTRQDNLQPISSRSLQAQVDVLDDGTELDNFEKYFGQELLEAKGMNPVKAGYLLLKDSPVYEDAEDDV
ncbi:MAG: hypothetical protein V3T23_10195 [Nitrososphaerales archaeon]